MGLLHVHNWKATAIHQVRQIPAGGSKNDLGFLHTYVLLGCRCMKVKVHKLDGHWTLEEVRAASGQ